MITTYFPWLLSVVTIWQMWLTGGISKWAWPVAIGNQALWLVWIIDSGTWGMLPMNAALWFVCTRNWLKWRHV